MKWFSLAFAMALACSANAQSVQQYPPPAKRPVLTDAQVAMAIVRMSRAQYYVHGPCACPDDLDRAGRSCGRRSAYSRPGGRVPLCYPRDVSNGMIADYRAGQLQLSGQ